MERKTFIDNDGFYIDGINGKVWSDIRGRFRGKAIDRLAAYEDAGLEPEEIAIIKNIVGRLATADYPHNFQRERSDIAAYMYWITSVMKDAKEWWNGMVTRDKGRDE